MKKDEQQTKKEKQQHAKKNINWSMLLVNIGTPILAALVTLFACLKFGSDNIVSNLAAALAGFFFGTFVTGTLDWTRRRLADKNKVSTDDLSYDEKTYKKDVHIGGKSTTIWYDAITNDVNTRYELFDDPTKKFVLDEFLTANYAAIMQAHQTSYVDNPTMIRLDDCVQQQDGSYKLSTSRTAYYNDLVTNRSMDYKFNGELTVRKVYEGGKYLTPLAESHMSNHIGIIAHVFYGNKTILAQRGGNATISKNKFTTCVAAGLSQDDVIKAHNATFRETNTKMTADDLLHVVLLHKLADRLNLKLDETLQLYNSGLIKIYLLGLGQLPYTGGKPQFYYAVTVDESVDLSEINNREVNKQQIDYNKKMLVVDQLSLTNGHKLSLKCSNNRDIVGEAERSFYIGLWHIQNQAKIGGIPEWAYCKPKTDETDK